MTDAGGSPPVHREPTGHGDPPDEPPQVGQAPTLGQTKLREASAELLVKREERGRDTASTLVGQVATVGTFLGAFTLLNDAGKTAVVQSDSSENALIATAVSLGLSLSTHFLLPSRMPSFDQLTKLQAFWNRRVLVRNFLLFCALVALGTAVWFALDAYGYARAAVEPQPAASVTSKVAAPAQGNASVEVASTWGSLEPGARTLTCVLASAGDVDERAISAAVGTADKSGAQTQTMSVPLGPGIEKLAISTYAFEDDGATGAGEELDNDALCACEEAATSGPRPGAEATVTLTP